MPGGRFSPSFFICLHTHHSPVKELRTVAESGDWGGDGRLRVNSKEGKSLIFAGRGLRGNGMLAVSSKEGKRLLYAGAGPEGNGTLTLSSKEGILQFILGSGDNGAFASLYNKPKECIIELRADEYGNGVVGAYNGKGKGRTLESGR